MINSEISIENNMSGKSRNNTKNSNNTELSPVEYTTDSTCRPRKKNECVIIKEEMTKHSIVSEKRVTRKIKKKINFNSNVQQTEKKDKLKLQKSRNNSLDDYENLYQSSSVDKKYVNKENQVTNSNKTKVFSPNHKLTEYFSDLKVCEIIENDVNKETNLEKKLIKDSQDLKQSAILSPKQSLTNTSSQGFRRKLRQPTKKSSIESNNHKVTEYFPVRKSERKCKKSILDEKQRDLEINILKQVEDGLEVIEIEGKGRGVVATKDFHKGDFVIEYIGDLISGSVAKQREAKYAKNKNIGCYMYYFKFRNTQYCIDATKESGKLGRLINHSRKGNLVSKIIEINQIPHLVLFAKIDIPIGTELLYDYGDRNKEALKHHPWLTL